MNHKVINWNIETCVKPIKKAINKHNTRQLLVNSSQYLRVSILLLSGLSSLLLTHAHANPNIADATVINGEVSFDQPNANTLNINNTSGAIIDWNAFSIDAGKSTRFIQENANSRVLNRVTGSASSNILGNLNSNGKVYVINPNGIVFGNAATVNTAGLVASTLNITNNDFITEKDRFNGTTGKITNQAQLMMSGDGNIVLIAPEIENQGSIQTENGKLILAAGQSVELVASNIVFEIQASNSSALNLGELLTQRGEIGVFTDQLVQAGTIRATEVVQDASGNITLQAKSSLEVRAGSSIQSMGGDIDLKSEGTTTIAGQVTSGATTAGSIAVTGRQITISGGLEASGSNAGNIIIGSLFQNIESSLQRTDTITLTSTGSVQANVVGAGNSGAISLLAGDAINMAGLLSAKGGIAATNTGGSIDVFGQQITLSGTVDASGNNGGNIFIGGTATSDLQDNPLQSTQNITVTNSGVVKADSLSSGNGGGIIAFAESALRVQGIFSAQGGSSTGNGGAIVTSGLTELTISTAPRLTAANGNSGEWLLRSTKLAIDASKASVISTALNNGIKVGLLASNELTSAKTAVRDVALKIGELALRKETTGDIEINSAINKTSNNVASLDIFGQTVAINAPITSTSGALNVALLTETGGLSDASTVNVNATINTNGGVLTASEGVLALVSAAAAAEDSTAAIIEDATREVASAARDISGGFEDTTLLETEMSSNEGNESNEGGEEEQSQEEEESEQKSEGGNESKDEEAEQSSPSQQC